MLREDLRVGGFESVCGGGTGKRCSCVRRLSTHSFLIFKCEKLQSSFAFVFFFSPHLQENTHPLIFHKRENGFTDSL